FSIVAFPALDALNRSVPPELINVGESAVALYRLMKPPGLLTNVALPALDVCEPLIRESIAIRPVLLKTLRLLPAVAPYRKEKLPSKVCTMPELLMMPPFLKVKAPLIVNWLAPALNVMS